MAEVTWAPAALRQWEEIVEYIARDSPDRAAKIADRLMEAPDKLVHSPKMGRRVPEFGRDDLRELVMVRPYRILYLVREGQCLIVAVIHSKRDLRRAFRLKDLENL